jgi:two-component system, OmpR family, response regulator
MTIARPKATRITAACGRVSQNVAEDQGVRGFSAGACRSGQDFQFAPPCQVHWCCQVRPPGPVSAPSPAHCPGPTMWALPAWCQTPPFGPVNVPELWQAPLLQLPLPSYTPPAGPVQRVVQLPASAADEVAPVNATTATAAKIVVFMVFLLAIPCPAGLAERRCHGECARCFSAVLPDAPADIAICCKADLTLASAADAGTIAGMDKPLAKILVVDDDDEIRSLLQVALTREGFDVQQAKDAPAARRILGAHNNVDLIILDIMMPGEDGLSFCQRLRETQDTPILMVSARTLSIDRSIGLEMGADDYLPKPFERRELVARVKAILRRGGTGPRAGKRHVGGFCVDRERRAVLDANEVALPLTAGEFDLLSCFVERPGRILSRDQLIDWTRGRTGAETFDRNIDVQMSRLRKKLIDAGFPDDGIKTVRNAGYILTLPVDHAS